jgi:hypothetical protein
MRRNRVPDPPKKQEIEQLLAQLRQQVAQLRRLERTSRDESDLQTRRQTIAELHWRLARLAGNHSDDGHYVAA